MRSARASYGRWIPRALAELLGQLPLAPPIDELMELYARALRELGECVQLRAAGSFAGFVEEAGGSAAELVRRLLAMPLWRDVARHDGQLVPFLKRAQLAVSDLAHALPDDLGRFRDLAELTLFADNLVPHVLRIDGVLRVTPELAARIEAEETIPAGSAEEVELRACAVDAVEQIAARMRGRGSRRDAARPRRLALAARRRAALQGAAAPPNALPVLLTDLGEEALQHRECGQHVLGQELLGLREQRISGP